MATKYAPIDPAGRDSATIQLDKLPTADVTETGRPTVKHVIGPDGRRLTLADLPVANTKRWVIRRKAEVVAAVRGGLISLDEACSRYALNPDEVLSWQHCIDRFGFAGLRTTRTQFYLRRMASAESWNIPVERKRLQRARGQGSVRALGKKKAPAGKE
jgi:Protein of unknown function (DUF1153)